MEKLLQTLIKRANLFNKYFSSQCNPLPNGSKLPENQTLQKLNYHLLILRMKIYTK